MISRISLIAGNWKMNGSTAMARDLAGSIAAAAEDRSCDLLICPPTPYLTVAADALDGSSVLLGGQDCHTSVSGAHTGDVSAEMLKDVGCRCVIVGHSERRQDHGESDTDVAAKVSAAHAAGLVAVICVGETEIERDQGRTMAVIAAQLDGSVPSGADATNTVIAYEPVWAIGTGRTPTPSEANDVHQQIREHLCVGWRENVEALRILYGGSMKPGNAADLLAQPDIDGGLIGGASLKAEDFLAIATAAST